VLILLAAALLKPSIAPAHDPLLLTIELPNRISTIENQQMEAARQTDFRKQQDVFINSTFFSRPDLRFSDSTQRSQKYSASTIPALEIGIEQSQRWKAGDGFVGPGLSLGFASWQAVNDVPQSLTELPISAFFKTSLPITPHFVLTSRMGLRASIYWSNRSTEFSSFSGWGRGFEANAGFEVPMKSSTLSAGLGFLTDVKAENTTRSLGIKLGWGIAL